MQPDPPDVDRTVSSALLPVTTEAPDGTAVGADGPVLAVPGSLHVTAATRDRMAAVLAAAPPGTLGVVAPATPLPPGGSVVSAGEWGLLEPVGTGEHRDPDVVGAVLLRPGVGHDVLADRVRVDPVAFAPGTALRLDAGSVASAAPTAVAADARPDGRPPFRWRPVVLFLAGVDDRRTADAAGGLVDALIPLDVEARLAVADPAPMLTRTQPCLPTQASVDALAPDVIVALDDVALDLADRWSPTRATSVVAWTPPLGDRIELIPWTIGIAQGRRRARIGPDADPERVAALIARLAAAPQPVAPGTAQDAPRTSGSTAPPAPVQIRTRGGDEPTPTAAAFRVVTGPAGPSPLLAGLADHLAAAGHAVHRDVAAGSAPAAGVITIADWPTEPEPDVVVVVADGRDLDEAPGIEAAAAGDPVWPNRPAIVGDHRVAARVRTLGGRPIVVPTLVPRADAAALLAAADHRVRPPEATVGWVVGPTGDEPDDHRRWSRAARAALDAAPDLRIDLVGPAAGDVDLDALGLAPAVTLRPRPDPSRLASWTAQVWMPPEGGAWPTGDSSVPARAALAGVPTVLARRDRAPLGGLALPALTVDDPSDPQAWAELVVGLLDDDARAHLASAARERAIALCGPDAAGPTIARVLGWLGAVRAT